MDEETTVCRTCAAIVAMSEQAAHRAFHEQLENLTRKVRVLDYAVMVDRARANGFDPGGSDVDRERPGPTSARGTEDSFAES